MSKLHNLLLNPPDVLVIGDNQDVIRMEEQYNWSRLEDDFENVHLGFVETFKWPDLPTESCVTYSGWLPNLRHGQKKIRLKKNDVWPFALMPIRDDRYEMALDEGPNLIEIDGNTTNWKYRKEESVLIASCPWSLNWFKTNKRCKVFEITIGQTEVKIKKVL